MAKTKDGARAPRTRTKSGTALVPVTGPTKALIRIDDPAGRGTVYQQGDVTMVAGVMHSFGGREVVIDAAYYVGGDRGRGEAPGRAARLGNADKLAWRDEATGYDCIIIRETRDGYLRGFVGVGPGHPLYGFEHDAVPADFDLEVHGGISYSAMCQRGPSPAPRLVQEARSICHVQIRPAVYDPVVNATDHRPQHDDAWWFGFDCNQLYDKVPGRVGDTARFLSAETGTTFRDESYVYDQVVDLAAQLCAIADGRPKPERTGPPPPPIGLAPRRAK
jgi:hypothetical protein